MIHLIVYFNGARSRWSGRAHPEEMLLEETMPWRWLARMRGQQVVRSFIAGRVGWAICTPDGQVLEQSDPTPEG
ncbi:MAG TPA: hypothetical protein VD932_03670 [Aquabacterium sp.]|nr:hypothetical protein [Aquabacterium sp.]